MAIPLLEICVDTPEGLRAAVEGGADRIELCAALDLGGLTPAPGLIALAARQPLPVRAMIRPRAGGFTYTQEERAAMLEDVDAARTAGLDGIVIGATTPQGALDHDFLATLIDRAGAMRITLHRAVDLLDGDDDLAEQAVQLGIDAILTSGGATHAADGAVRIARLVRQAAGRVGVMAGSGVSAENVRALVASTGVDAVHASCRAPLPAADPRLAALGFAAATPRDTDRSTVARLRAALDLLAERPA